MRATTPRRALLALPLLALPRPALAEPFRDDAGRLVTLPDAPARIVSLDDAAITVPLLELGVMPVASAGRVARDGSPFLRGGLALTGLDFDSTGMTFLGMRPIDLEAVAAARPALILTPVNGAAGMEQLAEIAPTVVLDQRRRGAAEAYALLAQLTGRQAVAARLERRYRAQIAEMRRVYRPGRHSAAVLSATGDGKLSIERSYGSLGGVLRDAGFRFPALFDSIPPHGSVTLSPELLQALDADFLFDTYRDDRGETPEAADRRMAALHPNYCRFLAACRQGRRLMLPRDAAAALSYQARTLMVGAVTAALEALRSNKP